MSKNYGTLREVLTWISDTERLYIGSKNGSGFFFIGTKNELGPEFEKALDRPVFDTYRKTLFVDEIGMVILIKGSPVRGNYWFYEEFLEAQRIIKPFNPYTEYSANRYMYDEVFDLGKFNRIYYESRIDIFGGQFAMSSFKDEEVERISRKLPSGCYIPPTSVLERWNEMHLGKDWKKNPEEVLKLYGVGLYGEIVNGRITHAGNRIYIASSDRSATIEGNRYLYIDDEKAMFCNRGSVEGAFIPVFFRKSTLLASKRFSETNDTP